MQVEYKVFDDFISLRGDVKEMRPGSNVWPALKRQLHSLLCVLAFLLTKWLVPLDSLLSPELTAQNFFLYTAFVYMGSHRIQMLWHHWTSLEASLIATGMGYKARSEKGKEEFNSVRAMDIFKFCTATTTAESITAWNCHTQHWLKYYVQIR